MSSSSSLTNSTSYSHPFKAAFSQEDLVNKMDALIFTLTQNGDLTFGSMGDDVQSTILELDQLMVREVKSKVQVHRPRLALNTVVKQKHHAPEEVTLSEYQRELLDNRFDAFLTKVSSLPNDKQVMWWSIMFRYVFYLRNLHGEGKRERLLFYYLFNKVHSIFPKTAEALVSLIPSYGYFGDLDKLLTIYSSKDDGRGVRDACVACYKEHLDADCLQVFGKEVGKVNFEEADAMNSKLKAMSKPELDAFVKGKRFSMASKWFKREGKKDADHMELFVGAFFFPNGGFEELKVTAPGTYHKRLNFSLMRLRKIITALTQCLAVGEQLMCARVGDSTDISRDWSDLEPSKFPATFATKYRKALLNETITPTLAYSVGQDGNRTTRSDRIECRKNVLKAILEGKLKGANQDLARLIEIVKGHCQNHAVSPALTSGERSLIAQQWRDMVAEVKKMVEEVVSAHSGDEDFIDPRNVIPVVDTSGSMTSANVQDKAIGLGLLATAISSIPGCMISFSDHPQVFNIDLEADIFDQYVSVINGPTGLNTNVDATYRLLLDIMVKNKMKKVDFALMFLTDGQFDSGLVLFEEDLKNSRLYYSGTDTKNKFEQVFLGRMEKAFNAKGFMLPRTIFWNLNGFGNGFCAASNTKGVQMLSGFSQTLMKQVFSGDFTVTVDLATGAKRVDVNPWSSFVKSVTSETFTPVMHKVLATQEGVFKTL